MNSLPTGSLLAALGRAWHVILLSLALAAAAVLPLAAQERVAVTTPRGAPDLEALMVLQRAMFPGAVVTGSFYDWRAPSKYRAVAGLHLGYDIGMPAGTPAVAGWPGQVTRIQPWFGAEHGVTVLSPSGFEATYGHITPRVRVGDVMNAGDVVGLVVNDHVDVKMRGPDGLFFDFGHATPPAVGLLPLSPAVRPTRADALRTYEMVWYGVQLDQEELRLSKRRQAQALAAFGEQRERVRRARVELPRLRQFLAEGLVARQEVEKAEEEARDGAERLAGLQRQMRDAQRDITVTESRVRAARGQLDAAWSVLAGLGMTRAAVERRLRKPSSPTAVAQARELRQMRTRVRVNGVNPLRVSAAKAEAERMEALFEQGVVSRVERDRAQARYVEARAGR